MLGLDYPNTRTEFLAFVPEGGVRIPFQPPPSYLEGFDSSFVEIEVATCGDSRTVLGLLDTGTTASVMRRGLVEEGTDKDDLCPALFYRPALTPDQLDVTVSHERLGTVAVRVGLFDTPGLPDLILGTDVMRVWADRWYFSFTPQGGSVTVFAQVDANTPAK